MTGTEYWIEKVSPTYLYLASLVLCILISLSLWVFIFTNRDVITELVMFQLGSYGISASRGDVSWCVNIFLGVSGIAIIVEIIRHMRVIFSKSEVVKR